MTVLGCQVKFADRNKFDADWIVQSLLSLYIHTQHLQIDLKFPKIQSAQNSFYQTEQKSNHAIVGGILKDDISVHCYGNIQSVGRSYTRNTVYLLLLSDWKFRQESHNVLLAKSILTVEKSTDPNLNTGRVVMC